TRITVLRRRFNRQPEAALRRNTQHVRCDRKGRRDASLALASRRASQKHVRVPRRTEAPPRLSALRSPSLATTEDRDQRRENRAQRGQRPENRAQRSDSADRHLTSVI